MTESRRSSWTTKASLPALLLFAACRGIYLSDAAVDLARCINNAAAHMVQSHLDSARVLCPVHDARVVTAVLTPRNSAPPNLDSAISLYRRLGLPEDAIFYTGPDIPTRGHFIVGRPVYVYDGGYPDHRKYSDTGALSQNVEIRHPMASTASRFVVTLHQTAGGAVVVQELQ